MDLTPVPLEQDSDFQGGTIVDVGKGEILGVNQ